jgi:hypothetical protein
MKTRTNLIVALTLALAAAFANAQTTIQARTVPSTDAAPQEQSSLALPRLPMPAEVTRQPTAVLPVNQEEMRRRISSAVEEILALYGNPPFAEVVTNDAIKAAALRAHLSLVGQTESLRVEVASLTARKAAMQAEVDAKEKELEYFRAQAARLQQALEVTVQRLTQMPSIVDAADTSPAAVAPAAQPAVPVPPATTIPKKEVKK